MDGVVLYVLSGLPGVGKTAVGRLFAERIGAVYLRIDTVEQGLREVCGISVEGQGYRLSYRIARDNLINGMSVIADSCNPIRLTRDEWNGVADEAGVSVCNIEVVCSDTVEHRERVESRVSDIDGLNLPDWDAVASREYHCWEDGLHITLDTAGKSPQQSLDELLAGLGLC